MYEDHEDLMELGDLMEDLEDPEAYENWESWESYEGDPETDLKVMGGDVEIFEEMEYLALLASESDNEEEVDYFIGAIASLAGPLISSLVGGGNGEYYETYEDMEGNELFEDEGDQFFPLIPLAASLLPKAIPLISKGVRAVGKALAEAACLARSTREACHLAAQAAGTHEDALAPLMPVLVQGAANAAGVLHGQRASRRFLRLLHWLELMLFGY